MRIYINKSDQQSYYIHPTPNNLEEFYTAELTQHDLDNIGVDDKFNPESGKFELCEESKNKRENAKKLADLRVEEYRLYKEMEFYRVTDEARAETIKSEWVDVVKSIKALERVINNASPESI